MCKDISVGYMLRQGLGRSWAKGGGLHTCIIPLFSGINDRKYGMVHLTSNLTTIFPLFISGNGFHAVCVCTCVFERVRLVQLFALSFIE